MLIKHETILGCCGYAPNIGPYGVNSVFVEGTSEAEVDEFLQLSQEQDAMLKEKQGKSFKVKDPFQNIWYASYVLERPPNSDDFKKEPEQPKLYRDSIVGWKIHYPNIENKFKSFIQHLSWGRTSLQQIKGFGTDLIEVHKQLKQIKAKCLTGIVFCSAKSVGAKTCIQHIHENYSVVHEVSWYNPRYPAGDDMHELHTMFFYKE